MENQTEASTKSTGRFSKRRFSHKLWVLLRNIVLALFFFLISAILIFQIPAVQAYVVGKITSFLSEELDTEVNAGRFYLTFFDQFQLENFLIKDQAGDTLIYVDNLFVDFNLLPKQLYNKRILVDQLKLKGGRINLQFDEFTETSNAAFLFDYFSTGGKKSDNGGLHLFKVEDLLLEDLKFVSGNAHTGQILDFDVSFGLLAGINLRPLDKIIQLKRVAFDKLIAHITDGLPAENYIPRDRSVIIDEVPLEDWEVPFAVESASVSISNSRVVYDNWFMEQREFQSEKAFDFNHLKINDLNLKVNEFFMQDLNFDGHLDELSFGADNGFRLKSLAADYFSVHSDGARLDGFHFITDNSYLGDTIVLRYDRYPDFLDFSNNVFLDINLKESTITLDDIMYFAEPLRRNDFFISNVNQKLNISGEIGGRVNSLSVRNFKMNLSDQLVAAGRFDLRNVTTPKDALVNFNLTNFSTDLKTLKRLIPGFNYPTNFNKLGRFNFAGNFDGFFDNFVAYGELRTVIGSAKLDMQLNFTDGRDLAQYSGSLSLINFDFGKWIDNDDFGKINFESDVKEGRGLTLEHLRAELRAEIVNFSYRDYNYENVTFDGLMRKDSISGLITIDDENLKFQIDGYVADLTSNPILDFDFDIERLHLKELNILTENIAISGRGNIAMLLPQKEDIDGLLIIKDVIISRDTTFQEIDSIVLYTRNVGNDNQLLALESDLINAEIMGSFKITEIPKIIKKDLRKDFPELSALINVKGTDTVFSVNRFSYRLDMNNPGKIPAMFNIDNFELDSLVLLGSFVGGGDFESEYTLEGGTNHWEFKNNVFDTLRLNLHRAGAEWDVSVRTNGYNLGKANWNDVNINIHGGNDELVVNFGVDEIGDKIHKVLLQGRLKAEEGAFLFNFLPSKFELAENIWTLTQTNSIKYHDSFLVVNNLLFETAESRKVLINSFDDFGIRTEILGLDLELLNEFVDANRYNFAGVIDANLNTSNIFTLEALNGNIKVEDFVLNNIPMGEFNLRAIAGGIKEPINITCNLRKDGGGIRAGGRLNIPRESEGGKITIDTKLIFDNYPLNVAEAFILDGISNTGGYLQGDLELSGPLNELDINGKVNIIEGRVKIDFLGTTYRTSQYPVYLRNDIIDFSSVVLSDELGNTATIKGGITHDRFKNLGLAVTISSNEFLMLNTGKGDNDLFYGRGYGKATIGFSGNFINTNIDINATTMESTKLSIPLFGSLDATNKDFITFTNNSNGEEDEEEEQERVIPEGLTMRMNLGVTNDAEIYMIFDERTGDILQGTGNGNLLINITREGEFEMYGEYVVTQGEYLFTLLNFVNKPFIVRQGGTIQWAGDPLDATLNLQAEYKGLRTPVYNFISDLVDGRAELAQVAADAKSATDVQLVMNLRGQLLEPDITFELGFPELESQLRTIVQNKLREVEADENELNRQVLGLIVFNNFFSTGFSGQDNTQLGINTLSGFLSAQISSYLSEVLSQAFTGVDFITGIDFDVGYNRYLGDNFDGANPLTGEEFNVRVRNTLFDDRLAINAGANLVSANELTGGYYIAGDLAVEYYLTEARRLKVKFYNRNDVTIYGPRQRTGIGLSFRKEFNNLEELFTGVKKDIVKKNLEER